MTTAERKARNDQIIELRIRGVPATQIARTFQVTTETIRQIMIEFRATEPKLRQHDPLDIVDEMLEGYRADLEELALVASTTTNPSVRVGAINSRMGARDRIIGLLQAVGVLPHELGKLQMEVDVRYTAQRMITVLKQYNVPLDVQEALLGVIDSAAGNGQPAIESTATAA